MTWMCVLHSSTSILGNYGTCKLKLLQSMVYLFPVATHGHDPSLLQKCEHMTK